MVNLVHLGHQSPQNEKTRIKVNRPRLEVWSYISNLIFLIVAKSPKTTTRVGNNGARKLTKEEQEELMKTDLSPKGRKAKAKMAPNVHTEFRKTTKTQAKGEKSKSSKAKRNKSKTSAKSKEKRGKSKDKKKVNKKHRKNEPEDLESNALETEEALITQGHDTFRKFLENESEVSIDSDSEDESVEPKALKHPTEEIDIRVFDHHPNVLEDIQEHTLFLLRAIFDSYDSKGDKIVKYFRKNKFSKALQVKELNLIDCPEELLREMNVSESIVLDPNEEDTMRNNITVLEGDHGDDSSAENSAERSLDVADVDPDYSATKSNKRIDKYGNEIDSDMNSSEARRRGIGKYGILGYEHSRGSQDFSEYTHHTPEPMDNITIIFEKGLDNNKPLNVDLSDSLGDSENDIVYYNKEDLTNFSKNMNLNRVRARPLPQIGLLRSTTTTPRSKKKSKRNDMSTEIVRKYNNLASIYEPDNKYRATSYSPSGKNRKNEDNESRLIKNKLKKRSDKLRKQKELEERQKKFRGLNLADRPKYKASMAAKLARNRLKKRKIDYDFYLDYESPYAEYLPHRYREWMPKEPKNLDPNLLQGGILNFEDKIDEVSHIYNADGQKSATSSVIHSRIGGRDRSSRLVKTRSKPKGKKSNPGLKNYKPNNQQTSKFNSRKPIVLDEVDDTFDFDSDNEPLKVFNNNKENQKKMTKIDKNNESAIQSEHGPKLQPVGMDIEDKSEGTMRPLFNREYGQNTQNRAKSSEEHIGFNVNQDHIPKNFATGEGIFDEIKQSEVSSDHIEFMDLKDQHKKPDSHESENNVKFNSLF